MVQRKIAYTLILGFSLLLGACKKDAFVTVSVRMAHTGEPISGSAWVITENKSAGGFGSGYEETNRWEGIIPPSGDAAIAYQYKKNRQYFMTFNHTAMNLPPGDYEIVSGPSGFVGNIGDGGGSYDIRVLPYMDYVFHYKNLSCFDSNDLFKYKIANIDEYQHHNFENQPWSTTTMFDGCCDYISPSCYCLAGHIVYMWEATRNGVTESGVDTCYVAPGVDDTVRIYW